MTILASMSAAQWIGVVGALLLLMGPGSALLMLHPGSQQWSPFEKVTIGAMLGLAAWPVMSLFLNTAGLHLSPVSIGLLGALGWCISGVVFVRSGAMRTGGIRLNRQSIATLMFCGVLLVHLLLNLYVLQGLVVAPGIDSYHHTLITQLVIDSGGMPANYLPYAPLETFSYHFGFHVIAGLTSMLTGIPARVMVPIIGQLLQTASLISMAALGRHLFGRSSVLLIIVAGLGFISPLPAAMANWSRYPQLMGQVMLPCVLILYRTWLQRGQPFTHIPWIALGICALGLTHYRVTLMAAVALAVLSLPVLAQMLRGRTVKAGLTSAVRLLSAGLAAAALFAAWPARLLAQHALGTPFVASKIGGGADVTQAASFYGVDRLGPWVLEHPNLMPLLILAGLAMAYALVRRNSGSLALTAWALALFTLSGPAGLGEYMDTISVTIASYIPLGLLIAWMLADAVRFIGASSRIPARGRSALALLALSAPMGFGVYRGAAAMLNAVEPANVWVSAADLAAADWAKANTTPDARFTGSTFAFHYSPSWVLGQDAAYWLPLLALRHTAVPPMIYDIENAADADYEQRLLALHALNNDFGASTAHDVLIQADIDYVYLGSRAPVQAVDALSKSPYLTEVYSQGGVRIFQVIPRAQIHTGMASGQKVDPR